MTEFSRRLRELDHGYHCQAHDKATKQSRGDVISHQPSLPLRVEETTPENRSQDFSHKLKEFFNETKRT